MPSQSFTFFFTVDVQRATDHSQMPIWSVPGLTSSGPAQPLNWVSGKPAPG